MDAFFVIVAIIYNPALRPTDGVADDDEDAEALAHILFYASKEKAVSRDRMLRQVGLAKALVNFSESFNAQVPCGSVHSQARRMITISPEPDFWIHAGIEVAKSHHLLPDIGKGKTKEKGKAASKPSDHTLPSYEYHDYSVQDDAIHSLLFRGYEQFKLTHGSFTQILSTLGQEALELQLERFFTVWAWSLDLEKLPEFGEHLGVPLHPAHRRIVNLLDSFGEDDGTLSIFAQPPHIVPSSSYPCNEYPLSLLRHILTLIPRPQPISDYPSNHVLATHTLDNTAVPSQGVSQQGLDLNSTGTESRKWYWPPYLTFGGKALPKPNLAAGALPDVKQEQQVEHNVSEPQVSEVDAHALEDAMSTETISAIPQAPAALAQSVSDSTAQAKSDNQTATTQNDDNDNDTQNDNDNDTQNDDNDNDTISAGRSSLRMQTIFIHLPEPTHPVLTMRRPLHYFIDDQRLIAVVPPADDVIATEASLITKAAAFFHALDEAFEDEALQSSIDHLPSAAKILQPLDRYIISKDGLCHSNPLFSSRSPRIYETRNILNNDPEVHEVFSRGQNPQHWHIAKRGLSAATGRQSEGNGEVYLEVFRKESSLADVDNVLAGIVRKSDL